jgi:asparagine synthase (glutamine-hydrolysing)
VKDNEVTIGAEIRRRLTSAVKGRIGGRTRTGAFLSGGLDSSTVVSLLRNEKENIQTFSFRCRGESFDESAYATIVSEAFGTRHEIVEYGPEEVVQAAEMVSLMDEPFCDVGINVATYLLSKAAAGRVDEVFTGDGGDELFGGHPVYLADRAARMMGLIPRLFRDAAFALGRTLPDSDRKKDWRVKIKRFSRSYAFPPALGTHRWRVYYLDEELGRLVAPEFLDGIDSNRMYDDVIGYNEEGSGGDPLDRSLYSDYQTVVQFYLRRMHMARAMGLSPKFPMLDAGIVAYCARIPSRWKIRRLSDTKYIERIAVEPLLPSEVVHRKDKLGHSIPLKNWMREHAEVQTFINDTLSMSSFRSMGLVQPGSVERMQEDHLTRRENHSHRLWALVILALWLEKHGHR